METLHATRENRRETAAELLDRLGPALCRLAGVLTDNLQLAEQLVLTAIAEHRSDGSAQRDLRVLSGAIYLDWASRDSAELAVDPAGRGPRPAPTTSSETLDDLHALPQDQLAAVALCKFGAHSYRQAADLLGVPAAELAQILCAALRNLDRPTLGRVLPSSAA